ncbi:MAG: hypothetical protein C4523_15885 [Myxococcales bacterium]|nr:MAG: hypothetical protein C4523_15885 [Myxococcales bacterium]
MRREYYCLKCRANLNPNVKIALVVVNGDRKALALFDPQPGNYEVIVHDDLRLRPGDQVEFLCPVCHADLTSPVDSRLAAIGYRVGDSVQGRVDFSKVKGEHATFFITRERVEAFGENANLYGGVNFFGEGLKEE